MLIIFLNDLHDFFNYNAFGVERYSLKWKIIFHEFPSHNNTLRWGVEGDR